MSDQPQVCYWRGKLVEELTREELIEAVKHLGRFFQHETSPEMVRVKLAGYAQVVGRRAQPVWSCGHAHQTRGEAIQCLEQRYMDPVQGLHPIGGLGVPHAGCGCKNCVDARRV